MRYKLILILWIFCGTVFATPFEETRYCGAPERDENGTIIRSSKVIYNFRKLHPCPSTGSFTGACPNWAINHVIPLACGGCDEVSNMMWMRNDVKKLVDAYERKISAKTPMEPDTAACVNQIVK